LRAGARVWASAVALAAVMLSASLLATDGGRESFDESVAPQPPEYPPGDAQLELDLNLRKLASGNGTDRLEMDLCVTVAGEAAATNMRIRAYVQERSGDGWCTRSVVDFDLGGFDKLPPGSSYCYFEEADVRNGRDVRVLACVTSGCCPVHHSVQGTLTA